MFESGQTLGLAGVTANVNEGSGLMVTTDEAVADPQVPDLVTVTVYVFDDVTAAVCALPKALDQA
jgi:hypothetical protein